MSKRIFNTILYVVATVAAFAQNNLEPYRPIFHFTPAQNWVNDPNGLVYFDGEYHLFYQYNPFGDQWGNMSWGHAVSNDLINWQELPVALPMVGNVMAFSGSAVIDWNNTSGFGAVGAPAMVAIYTAANQQQTQYVAYSNDKGRTWTNYANNPVLNLYNDDFRDPKVIWHAPSQRWVMVVALAAKRLVRFYTSTDLKNWQFLQDFGQVGDVSGVWECPDFFPLHDKWVLEVDIAPGLAQYFVGDFDGFHFEADKFPTQTASTLPNSTLIADFEGNNYGNWTITGNAFGNAPVPGTLTNQLPVSGFLGSGFVNSYHGGDASTGTMRSPNFTITHPFINFKIGGGNHPSDALIRLTVNGNTVTSSTGSNHEFLEWDSWDVSSYIGQTAYIEIIDNATGGWGHINIDHIFQSDVSMLGRTPPAASAIIDDFEDFGYNGWTVTGAAFGSSPALGTLPGQQSVTAYIGTGLVNSFMNGDATQGKMTSDPFVIDSNYISFLIGGGNHIDSTFIRLLINNQEVRRSTGRNSEALIWQNWEVSNYTGQTAIIEIIDSAVAAWGHINIDHLMQSNIPPSEAVHDKIDFGEDFYAVQSFSDIPPNSDGRRIWLAWMSNWSYAGAVPTTPWRGAMTIPRTVEISQINNEIVLTQQPVMELQSLRTQHVQFQNSSISTIKNSFDALAFPTFELKTTIDVGTAQQIGFKFKKGNGQSTVLTYDVNAAALLLDRSNSGALTNNGAFATIKSAPMPLDSQRIQLHILVDHSSIEIFAQKGQIAMTNLIFPDSSSNGMEIFTTGGDAQVLAMDVWQLENPNFTIRDHAIQPQTAIQLSPNPAHDYLRLQMELPKHTTATVQLIDVQGRVVFENIYTNINDGVLVPVQQLATGVYGVRVLADGAAWTELVVVE